jgi:hypothetical protein
MSCGTIYLKLTFENTYFMGNECRTESDHRKTTHTKQTRPGYMRTNTHAPTGMRTNWQPKTMPSSFHNLILKHVRSLLFLSGERPAQAPIEITSNSYVKHPTPCNGSYEVLLPILEAEVRKEKDHVIPSHQLEKLLLITSENCQNTYGVRTRSVIT